MVVTGTFCHYCHEECHRQEVAGDDGASGGDEGGDSDNRMEMVVVVLLQKGPRV